MSPNHRPDPDDARSRTLDWSILGLASDPAPGDPAYLRLLAYQLQDRADRVEQIRGEVRTLMTDESLLAWIGASGDAFRKAMLPFPMQLGNVHQAYSDASAALTAYAAALDDIQYVASNAYGQGAQAWRDADIVPGPAGMGPVGSDGAFRTSAEAILQRKQSSAPAVANGNGTAPPSGPPSYSGTLETLVSARQNAENAGYQWAFAGKKCQSVLEGAADAMAHAVTQSEMTFDAQFQLYGGNPSDLVLVQHGDAAFIAAVDTILADYARKDAEDLAKAVANPDDPASKAIIDKVGADLVNAQNDPAYLQAFYAAGGAQSTAKLLMQLAPADTEVLADPKARDAYAAKDLINQYAIGVAAATRLSDLGEVKLPEDVWEPLWHGDTVDRTHQIPAALLLAFGPTGDQYGHTFLADAGTRILHFDGSSQVLPSDGYSKMTDPYSYYDIAGDTWGLAPDILKRVGENPGACRDLLDPTRLPADQVDANYQALLYHASEIPYSPKDGLAATIIHNATTDLAGHPDSALEASAALFKNLNGQSLTPGLAMAVSQAACAHLDSMMENATNKMVDGPPNHQSGLIALDPHQMDNVLKSFAADQHAVENLNGAIGAKTLGLSRLGDFGTGNGTTADLDALKQLGNLQGDLSLHQQQAGVDVAHQQDKTNAMYQNWIRTVTGEANALGPLPLKVIHNANPAMAPFYESLLPTDNAAKAADEASFTLSAGASTLDVPLVQGMIDRGQIVPPPGAPWMRGGVVDLSTPDARNQFNYWHDHQQGPGMDLVRTLSNTVTSGYDQSGMKWDLK